MIPEYLLNYPWIPAIAWIILYTSDYYLTLWGARLSRSQSIMRREGSYELTPGYVSDINEQRKFSPTFLFWLLIGTLVLLFFCTIGSRVAELLWFIGWLFSFSGIGNPYQTFLKYMLLSFPFKSGGCRN